MLSVATIGLRAVLLLSAAVVLGLSVTLAKHQRVGSVPAETGFGSFAGAFGIIVAAVGIAAVFVERIPGVVTLVADALAGLCFLAGGIALALALRGISCTSSSPLAGRDRFRNKILNGGCESDGSCYAGGGGSDALDKQTQDSLKGRCTRAQADFAFEFIALALCLGSLVLTVLTRRGQGKSVYV